MKSWMGAAALLFTMFSACGAFAQEKKLDGEWLAIDAVQNGKKMDKSYFKDNIVAFKGDKYTATLGRAKDEGDLIVDWSKTPPTIDMKPKSGAASGLTMTGILELKEDTLKISFNLETPDRPKDFTSTAENKHFVVTYKRKK